MRPSSGALDVELQHMFPAPRFWTGGGGLETRSVGRVYGAYGARHHPHRIPSPPPIQKLGAENHMLQLNI